MQLHRAHVPNCTELPMCPIALATCTILICHSNAKQPTKRIAACGYLDFFPSVKMGHTPMLAWERPGLSSPTHLSTNVEPDLYSIITTQSLAIYSGKRLYQEVADSCTRNQEMLDCLCPWNAWPAVHLSSCSHKF